MFAKTRSPFSVRSVADVVPVNTKLPPLMTTAAVASANPFPNSRVPPEMVTVPVNRLAAVKATRSPVDFVTSAAPDNTALTDPFRRSYSAPARVPFWSVPLAKVTVPAVCVVPPRSTTDPLLRLSDPVLSSPAPAIFRDPPWTSINPLNVFAALRRTVPGPLFVTVELPFNTAATVPAARLNAVAVKEPVP